MRRWSPVFALMRALAIVLALVATSCRSELQIQRAAGRMRTAINQLGFGVLTTYDAQDRVVRQSDSFAKTQHNIYRTP